MPSPRRLVFTPLALATWVDLVDGWQAAEPNPVDAKLGWVTLATNLPFEDVSLRLAEAARAHDTDLMRACDPAGATPPIDPQILGLFRNGAARRQLVAGMALGSEAPLRFHLAETGKGACTLSYQQPSATFFASTAGGDETLRLMSAELDRLFAEIADKATKS